MDAYHMTAGDTELFDRAPPMAEVVLEDISRKQKRIIFAEAFRAGAKWWQVDGRRGRRGLPADRLSDYRCAATRSPRPGELERLRAEQIVWDLQHMVEKDCQMYPSTRPCMGCGEPVSDGMIHACKGTLMTTPDFPPITAKGCPRCGIVGAHFCTGRQTATPFPDINWHDGHGIQLSPKPAPDAFTSVFEPQNNDNWIRINLAGRIKFSEAMMLRFAGMKIDVAIDGKGRVRVGEAEHGKILSDRGYVYARRLVPLIDYKGLTSALVFLHENADGWLYGDLSMAVPAEGKLG